VLRANPDYYGGAPRAPQLLLEVLRDYQTRFAALEAGRIDAAPLLPDTWRAVKDEPAFRARFDVREFRQLYFFYVAWRMTAATLVRRRAGAPRDDAGGSTGPATSRRSRPGSDGPR